VQLPIKLGLLLCRRRRSGYRDPLNRLVLCQNIPSHDRRISMEDLMMILPVSVGHTDGYWAVLYKRKLLISENHPVSSAGVHM
jgi:hypothetical protein